MPPPCCCSWFSSAISAASIATIPFTQVSAHLAEIKPLSLIIAAVTFTVMWNAKKISAKTPPMLIGIVVGCGLYYLGQAIGLGPYLGPVIANQERAVMGLTAFPYFSNLKHSGELLAFVPTILSGALALAMIASIDALLCTKLVTAAGEPRRDGDGILLRLGIANVAAACFGGITGGINIGASVTNRTFGARSALAVLINAAALLVAGVLLFRWLGAIPRVALSAVIMVIAVQHFDLWSLKLLGRLRDEPRSLRDQHGIRRAGGHRGRRIVDCAQHCRRGLYRPCHRGCPVCCPYEPVGGAAQLSLR